MTDDRLDQLLDDARSTYRVPPPPPTAAMWEAIEQSLAEPETPELTMLPPARGASSARAWRMPALVAATLLIGVAVGRYSAATSGDVPSDTMPTAELTPVALTPEPLNRATSALLGETEALLRDLQALATRAPSADVAAQATTLLVTTRLLLDSPSSTDLRLQLLLEDLELVLAQIAALNGPDMGGRRLEEMQIIRDALTQRDVVPRLRTAVVTLASYDD